MPYCTEVADTVGLFSSASGEADGSFYQAIYTIPVNGTSVATPYMASDHSFFDTGDRSFVYDLAQYPFFFVSPYVVWHKT